MWWSYFLSQGTIYYLSVTFYFIYKFIYEYLLSIIANFGEGSGTPLQYSCLENPVDGGAWWAAVHRVTLNWTTTEVT